MTGGEAEQVSRSQTLKDSAEKSSLYPKDREPLRDFEESHD